MTESSPLQLISPADALAITTASSQFGHLVDRGRATDCIHLFAANAKLIFGPGSPKPGELSGNEAIARFLEGRQALTHVTTRHIASNFRFAPENNDRVRCDSLLTVFRSNDESRVPVVNVVCDIGELFVRGSNGAWLIAERLTTPIFFHA